MQKETPRRVLVIEDEESVAKVLKRRLEVSGYLTHTVARGEDALSYMTEHRADLVILDIMLPDLNGYEVSRELRKRYSHWDVPILMLTGLSGPLDRLRGLTHGADAYVTKPYEPAELLEEIALLLGETDLSSETWTL